MDNKVVELFRREVEKNFSFLVASGNFTGPYSNIDEKTWIYTVSYQGQQVAVQLILDRRDEDIGCKVAKVIDGHITSDYAIDSNGAVVRDHLFKLLERNNSVSQQFTKVTGLPFEEQIPITLADYARMLLEDGEDVVADNADIFKDDKSQIP